MRISEKTPNATGLTLFGSAAIALDLASVALAAAGCFYRAAVLGTFALIAIGPIGWLIVRDRKRPNRESVIAAVAFLAISLLIAWNPQPTVFSGRDQGSFSEAAIRLAENHRLEFDTEASREFFRIYGPGTALNFPGFNYTSQGKLVTHFSLGYIGWLATFYSIFGLAGLSLANAIAFCLFLFSFYSLLRLFLGLWPSAIGTAFVLSSFVFHWIVQLTLGENLALGLLWFAIFQAVRFFRLKESQALPIALAGLLVLSFTRLESWAFVAMLLGMLAFASGSFRKGLRSLGSRRFLVFLALFLIVAAIGAKADSAFYVSSAKGLLKSFSGTDSDGNLFSQLISLGKVFDLYALSQFFLIGLIGLAWFSAKRDLPALVPVLIVLPTAAYLFHPGISQDYPWMLRRFVFSLLPAAIFYATLLLDRFFKKRLYFNAVSFLIIATNLLILLACSPAVADDGLLDQARMLSDRFSDHDLVLADRNATGDGWRMMSGPLSFLWNKQAVYFFNPEDYAKLDLSRFDSVFLIAPDSGIDFYAGFPDFPDLSKAESESYSLKTVSLPDPETERETGLPISERTTVSGRIYKLR